MKGKFTLSFLSYVPTSFCFDAVVQSAHPALQLAMVLAEFGTYLCLVHGGNLIALRFSLHDSRIH